MNLSKVWAAPSCLAFDQQNKRSLWGSRLSIKQLERKGLVGPHYRSGVTSQRGRGGLYDSKAICQCQSDTVGTLSSKSSLPSNRLIGKILSFVPTRSTPSPPPPRKLGHPKLKKKCFFFCILGYSKHIIFSCKSHTFGVTDDFLCDFWWFCWLGLGNPRQIFPMRLFEGSP